jgi:pimeloyl-ACP methyl ester carboxylesterase
MHYATEGSGKLLMFLHGFPEYWGVWKKQFAEFSKDYQVVAPDMRGYNLTEKPVEVEKYHINYLVSDVRALADHLGEKKFYLVGQDWGAQVAWSFVLRHPDYVEKFVSINATHPAIFNRDLRTNPDQQKASSYMLEFRSPEGEEKVHADDFAWLRKAVFADVLTKGLITREEVDEQVEAWRQPGAMTGGLNYYRAAREGPPDGKGDPGGSNLLDDLKPEDLTVNVPTLLIYGERDPYRLPCSLKGLEEYVSNLTLKSIPDATHWITMEKPALLNSLLREFFS